MSVGYLQVAVNQIITEFGARLVLGKFRLRATHVGHVLVRKWYFSSLFEVSLPVASIYANSRYKLARYVRALETFMRIAADLTGASP